MNKKKKEMKFNLISKKLNKLRNKEQLDKKKKKKWTKKKIEL